MKVIPTTYRGIQYRSRTEARWRVFFETLGIKTEYEKEGYELADGRYLPDFYLPDLDCFVEIKGSKPTRKEQELAYSLSKESGKPVHIFSGSVPEPGIETWNDSDFETFTFDARSKEETLSGQLFLKSVYAINQCPKCKKYGFAPRGIISKLPCRCTNNHSNQFSNLVKEGYRKARMARFEFEDRR